MRTSGAATPPGPSTLRWYQRLVELVALCGFAIAQPVLATFGGSPDTFIFRDASRWDVVVFALTVAIVPPVVLWLVETTVGIAGPRALRIAHLAVVGTLVGVVGVQVVKQVASLQGVVVVVL